MKGLIKLTLCATICATSIQASAQQALTLFSDNDVLSLSNLERERAALINDLLNPALDFDKRITLINKRQRQLSDMERMVIRDERLLHSNKHIVKNAFDHYDLTFLVHAGAENNKSATIQWLEQVKFDSSSVLNASAGYR